MATITAIADDLTAPRAFTVSQCAPGVYHVTCWNAPHTSCGVFTAYDPGFSPWPDPMLLSENIAALEAAGRVNMTGKRFDHRAGEWVSA